MNPATTGTPSAADRAAYLASLDCVHCGLCLQHCPTYLETGLESASPRGRLYLMRALLEERIEPTPDVTRDLDLCLVCRACETACPSGVRYGEIIADTRATLRRRGFWRRWLMGRLAEPVRLRRFAALLALWQRLPLRALLRLLPKRLRVMESMMPAIPKSSERRPLPAFTPAIGTRLGTVALLEGCVMSVLFADVNRDTVKLLTNAGQDVIVPEGQGCCGALHEHDGDLATAKDLLEKNARAFHDPAITFIINNSAGCGAALVGAEHHAPGPEVAALARKSIDISRFLADHGSMLRFLPSDEIVTYDAPCHLHHAQRETTAPLDLLKRIPGLHIVPLEDASLCCGAAGIYNLDEPEMSLSILARKLDQLEKTGASVLLTGNPGCLLQWRRGVLERGLKVEVLHPVTFLARQIETKESG